MAGTQVQGVPQGLVEEEIPQQKTQSVQGVPEGLTEEALPAPNNPALETAKANVAKYPKQEAQEENHWMGNLVPQAAATIMHSIADSAPIRMAEELGRKGTEFGSKVGADVGEAVTTGADILSHPIRSFEQATGVDFNNPMRSQFQPTVPTQTPEQIAEQEHPMAMGITRGAGRAAGGFVGGFADPRLAALTVATMGGGTVGPVLSKIASGGFGLQMGAHAIGVAADLAQNWDKYTTEQRAQLITEAGLSGYFGAKALGHTGVPEVIADRAKTAVTPLVKTTGHALEGATTPAVAGMAAGGALGAKLGGATGGEMGGVAGGALASGIAQSMGKSPLEPMVRFPRMTNFGKEATVDKAQWSDSIHNPPAAPEPQAQPTRPATPEQIRQNLVPAKQASGEYTEPKEQAATPQEDQGLKVLQTAYDKANEAYQKAFQDREAYRASIDQGIEPPAKVQKAFEKAEKALNEAQFHLDTAESNKVAPVDETQGIREKLVPAKESAGAYEPEKGPENVKKPGEVAPERIAPVRMNKGFETEPIPTIRGGQHELPQGGTMGKPLQLPGEVGDSSAFNNVEDIRSRMVPAREEAGDYTAPAEAPISKTVNKIGDLTREGLGGQELQRNKPLREQVPNKGPVEPVEKVEGEVLPPEKEQTQAQKAWETALRDMGQDETGEEKTIEGEVKLSSRPDKAELQKAGAGPETMEKLLNLSQVELRQLAIAAGEDMGQEAIGSGKNPKASGKTPRQEVFQRLLKNHTPEELAQMVDDGKHLPEVSGGSQDADETLADKAKRIWSFIRHSWKGLDEEAAKKKAASMGGTFGKVPISELDTTNLDVNRLSTKQQSDLVSSIKKNGIKEPLLIGKDPQGNLRVLDGSHRVRAAIEAGLTEVPAIRFRDPEQNLADLEKKALSVSGGSQGAAPAPFTKEAADLDTDLFKRARIALGEQAPISEVAKLAQEMKKEIYSGPERRATPRTAPLGAKELEEAIKQRKNPTTPFDVTEGASKTIEADKNMPKAPQTEISKLVDAANKKEGREPVDWSKPEEISKDSKRIADAYDEAKHEPDNPEVKKSYDSLIDDVKKQWNYIQKKMGISIEPQEEDPYKSFDEVKQDVEKNHRLKVFTGGNPLPEDHPMAKVDPKTGENYNTMFRAVHDIFGHLSGNNDFSQLGEEGAWKSHRQTLSPEAIPAMTNETRSQTSSFFKNNGFPEQKATIPPDFAMSDASDAKKVFDHIKSGKDYALLTAENPGNERLSDEDNLARNQEFLKELRDKGYNPVPVEGHVKDVPGQHEHSFFIPDISAKDIKALGEKYGQASVLTSKGLYDLKNDTTIPIDDSKIVTGKDAENQDYFSKIGGEAFSIPVDFSGETKNLPGTDLTVKTDSSTHTLPSGKERTDYTVSAHDKDGKPVGEITFSDTGDLGLEREGKAAQTTGSKVEENLRNKGIGSKLYNAALQHAKSLGFDYFAASSHVTLSSAARGAWEKMMRDNGYKNVANDPEETDFAVDLKNDPKLQQEAPKASMETARMSDAELKSAGFAPEQIENGEHLPSVSGGKSTKLGRKTTKAQAESLAKEHLQEGEDFKSEGGRASFIKNLMDLPSVQEFKDIAKAGETGRKWYERSQQAFDALIKSAPRYFQEGDRQKFTDFLASLSPQQSVKMNLQEALHTWSKYVDMGRPEGKALEKMLSKELTLPKAKVPNAMKALAGEDLWPTLSKNEYFKVPSFAKNLRGFMDAVTNDGWQAAFAGLDAKALKSAQSYHPLAVLTRAAAKELGWNPAEAQAAIWAFTKTLTEHGNKAPEEITKYSEDFADLLAHDQAVRDQLSDLGIDLGELDGHLKEIERKPEVTSGASSTSENSIGKLAKRLEKQRGKLPQPKDSGLFDRIDTQDRESFFKPRQEGTDFEFGANEPIIKKTRMKR